VTTHCGEIKIYIINMSLTTVSSSVNDIEARAAKFNASAQRGSQEVLARFEPNIFLLLDRRPTT